MFVRVSHPQTPDLRMTRCIEKWWSSKRIHNNLQWQQNKLERTISTQKRKKMDNFRWKQRNSNEPPTKKTSLHIWRNLSSPLWNIWSNNNYQFSTKTFRGNRLFGVKSYLGNLQLETWRTRKSCTIIGPNAIYKIIDMIQKNK